MKDLKLYVLAASALLVVYLFAQYNRPKAVDWRDTYSNTDKIPFGTYILYNRLHDIFPKANIQNYRYPLNDVINDDSLKNSAYLIVCNGLRLSDNDFDALVKYIRQGNDVFIAANSFGRVLHSKLDIDTESELEANSQTYLNFVSKAMGDTTYLVDHNSSNGYFSDFDTVKTKVLGKNGYNHASFIKIPMGKGAFFLNANPQMFTNYSLLQDKGADYAAKALSFVRLEKGLVWDEFYSKGRENEDSSMRVFLSHPPLRWAFYIVFFSLLLFVVYQSKRRQRIIPIIEPVSNTSVEFAKIVGQVYYEQHNNSNIAQKKVAYFLEYIRARYHLKTSVQDTEFIQALIQKSGAQPALVQAIFHQVALVQNGHEINNNTLIELNQNIEQFYLQSS